jgi:hypothetical protein
MRMRPDLSKLNTLSIASVVAVSVAANVAVTWAGDNSGGNKLHGPGSSHNPIVYHPVHGPGSSHNPIVSKSGGNALPVGTVVRDHRNGKSCQYTVGDCRSMQAYRACEGLPSGGRCP